MPLQRRLLLSLLKLADLAVVAAAFTAALVITGAATETRTWLDILEVRIKVENLLFMAIYLLVWRAILQARGLYSSHRLSGPVREYAEIAVVVPLATGLLLPSAALFRFEYVTAAFLLLFAAIALAGLCAERRILRAASAIVRRHGRNLRHVIVVGSGDSALDLMSTLARRHDLGYAIAAVIDASPDGAGNGDGHGTGPDGILQRIQALLDRQPIDEIFLAVPLDTALPLVREIMGRCEEQGITVRLMTRVTELYWAQAHLDSLEGQPVLTVSSGPVDHVGLLFKRVIDVIGAAAGLIVVAPLFVLAAIAIKLDSQGPVFFAQDRVGQNRRRFRAYKFRTMVADAEKMQALLEPLNEASGPVFKIRNDPRATRVGRWLRRLSIDELPQLFNVLQGDMSLVGPRPLPVRDVERINVRWHKRRFSVKPGITCLWQINSRQPEFDEWIRLDMEYIDNWSLALDLKILARTIPAVLSGQGAS